MIQLKSVLLAVSFLVLSASLFAQGRLNVDSISNYKFPNPSLLNTNEVWGHVDSNGTEYALVGRGNGFSVISLADPTRPDVVYSDTSALSLWRDIKTWNGYAYVVNEDRNGLEIFDLNNLPGPVRKVGSFTGDAYPLQKAHNLWIDSNGVAYIFGSNNNLSNSAGTIFLDLYTDPESPKELGNYDSLYIHDGYTRNDTLFAGAVNAGKLLIIDVVDKANPRLIGSITTPSSFTHNVWLSDNGKTAFTTDEVSGAYITAYDVSNPSTPFERDRIRTRNTTDVIPHNTHVLRDFLVTSYYTSGVSIVDGSNPDNMVEVGYFDCSPNFSGNGFFGNWGAYPFLPSGLLLLTDMQEGLFVLRPNYQRASYLEVFLNDCNGNRISQANVILNNDIQEKTNLIGKAEIGTILDGFYSLRVEAAAFNTIILDSVEMRPGVTKRISLLMQDTSSGLVNFIIDQNQNRIQNARVMIENADTTASLLSNANGLVKFEDLEYGTYNRRIGAWGYENKCFSSVVYDCVNDTNLYILEKKTEDFFEVDLGWTVSGNETVGNWTIAKPIGTVDRVFVANPGADVDSDCGDKAYVTGNGAGDADLFDVDSTAILTSPLFNLSGYIEPYLVFYTWFYNGGVAPNDQMLIRLIDTAGNVTVIDTIAERGTSTYWQLHDMKVSNYMNPLALAHIQFEVKDRGAQHILEAGIDHFFVSEGKYIGLAEQTKDQEWSIYPNPFEGKIFLQSSTPIQGKIELFDASMRLMHSSFVNASQYTIESAESLENGIYFLKYTGTDGTAKLKKLIKQ